MLQLNEIRYKNYFETVKDGSIIQISGFRTYSTGKPLVRYENHGGEYGLDQIKPIQLTEEWLLKFGFEKDKYRMSDLVYFEKGDITIDLNPDGIFKLHIGTVFVKNIYLVHKLQNFYFEYEGSELVFSTEP